MLALLLMLRSVLLLPSEVSRPAFIMLNYPSGFFAASPPPSALLSTGNASGMLAAKYYECKQFEDCDLFSTKFATAVPHIFQCGGRINSLNFWNFDPFLSDCGLIDNFAAIFNGNIFIPSTGTWTFYVAVDDYVKLFIDDTLVVSSRYNGMNEDSGTAALTRGQHSIMVHFYELSGAARLVVQWEGPGTPKDVIPSSAFSYIGTTLQPGAPGPTSYCHDNYRRCPFRRNCRNGHIDGLEVGRC